MYNKNKNGRSKNNLMKLYYITGEPLPKYRGILHYFVTIII